MSAQPEPFALPERWYCYRINDGVDTKKPGIYEWRIAGAGSYIGQYRWISRPKTHYGRNLVKLFNRLPYRNRNPEGFRRIHKALAEAHRDGRRIELIIVENVELKIERNRREQALIKSRGNLNGRRADQNSN
jgi:hypothetical protein